MNPDVEWSTREKLAIASYVFHTGDQHWTGKVNRILRPLGEPDRPPDWFSPKNCAQQYTALMEVAESSRKTRPERSDSHDSITGSSTLQVSTPSISEVVLQKATQERIDELQSLIRNERTKYKNILQTIEQLESGQLNDKIDEMYLEAKKQELKEEQSTSSFEIDVKSSEAMDIDVKNESSTSSTSLEPNTSESTNKKKDSEVEPMIEKESDKTKTSNESPIKTLEKEFSSNTAEITVEEPMQTETSEGHVLSKTPSPSPLVEKEDTISSVTSSSRTLPTPTPIIDSDSCDDDEMSESVQDSIKTGESNSVKASSPIAASLETIDNETTATSDGKLVKTSREAENKILLASLSGQFAFNDEESSMDASVEPSTEKNTDDSFKTSDERNIFEELEKASEHIVTESSESKSENLSVPHESSDDENTSKTLEVTDLTNLDGTENEPSNESQEEEEKWKSEQEEEKEESEQEEEKGELKQEEVRSPPPIPAADDVSTIIESGATVPDSKVAVETGEYHDDKPAFKDSAPAESDAKDGQAESLLFEERKAEEDSADYGSSATSSIAYAESFPGSPALSTTSDADPEATAQLRAWKKSIIILWKQVASHKYASLFLHPVTNEIAPNYSSIVLRPMDLSTLKKNVESGLSAFKDNLSQVRTTSEFQRDLMLMFQNALMYNNCEHDVYKMAEEMQKDVMDQVGQFLTTQLMMETTKQASAKGLRRSTLRKSVVLEKGSDTRSKRSSDTESKKK